MGDFSGNNLRDVFAKAKQKEEEDKEAAKQIDTVEKMYKEVKKYATLTCYTEVHPTAMAWHGGTLNIIATCGDIMPSQLLTKVYVEFPGAIVGLLNEAWHMSNPPPGVNMNAMTPEERKANGVGSSIIARVFKYPCRQHEVLGIALLDDARNLGEFKDK